MFTVVLQNNTKQTDETSATCYIEATACKALPTGPTQYDTALTYATYLLLN